MPLAAAITLAVLAAVLIFVVCFLLYVANTTYHVTCYHSDSDKKRHSDPHIEFGDEQYEAVTPEIHRLVSEAESAPCEEVEISSSKDGTKLVGNLYTFGNSDILHIFFHGYRGTALRDGCGGFKMAKDEGRSILMVDQRANGRSGGNVITFGVYERLDCLDWVNYAVKRFGTGVKIVLSGVSLGAATVLMASDLPLPENVKCIIADCGYSSPKEIICKVAKEGGYPVSLCWPLLKLSCRIRAGFDLDSSSAVQSVSNTKIPILIIHGDDDRYVPCEMAYKIFNACASPKKELLIVPTAPHAAAYLIDTEKYESTAKRFMDECLGE